LVELPHPTENAQMPPSDLNPQTALALAKVKQPASFNMIPESTPITTPPPSAFPSAVEPSPDPPLDEPHPANTTAANKQESLWSRDMIFLS
jgi:hypothetical protein